MSVLPSYYMHSTLVSCEQEDDKAEEEMEVEYEEDQKEVDADAEYME